MQSGRPQANFLNKTVKNLFKLNSHHTKSSEPIRIRHPMWRASIDTKGTSMKISSKILIYLIVFAIIDTLIPLPITAMLLIYILREKPHWFKNLVIRLYDT
jgi:hypothetical protein